MRLFFVIQIIIATPINAFAECATPQDTFLSCTFSQGRKAVDVCVEGDMLTYRFGAVGKTPDLVMSVPVVNADYTPWPGVSRSIWETVAFLNRGVRYEVTGSIDRNYYENDEVQIEDRGMIEVIKGEQTLATLECDAGSVEFAYGGSIYDAKTAAGQCWDFEGLRWGTCK